MNTSSLNKDQGKVKPDGEIQNAPLLIGHHIELPFAVALLDTESLRAEQQ